MLCYDNYHITRGQEFFSFIIILWKHHYICSLLLTQTLCGSWQLFYFFHFTSLCILFSFFALFEWLELSSLCCIRVVNILAFFLILWGKAFSILSLSMLAVGVEYFLWSWENSLFLVLSEFFFYHSVDFCQMLFLNWFM